jgi:PHD/YefM family antitoxin component YafN of YafNO toxin-antitoxin module
MIKHGLMALAASAALAVAGCGGGDDNKTLSYSDFGKKADEVCTQVNAKTDPIGSKLTGKVDNDAQYYSQLIPAVEQGRKDFADLKPPSELKADYDKFLSITDQQIANAKKAEAAAKAGNQAEYIAILKATQPLQQESNAAASKLGAAVCAK